MNPTKYYGVYRASNATGTKSLATVVQEENRFPPSITYQNTTYTLNHIQQVSTDSQEAAFKEFCERNNMETDVII